MKKLLLLASLSFSSLVLMLGLGFGTVSAAAAPHPAPTFAALFDASKDAACGGAASQDNPVQCGSGNTDKTINDLIGTALNFLSIIVGIAAVIMIMVGGFKYVTSQGESANTASARNTIMYAIIGLVVVALAQFIVRFVLVKLNPKPKAATAVMIQEVDL